MSTVLGGKSEFDSKVEQKLQLVVQGTSEWVT